MLDNIIFGPPIMFERDEDIPKVCQTLNDHNWVAFYITKSGDMFEAMRATAPLQRQKHLIGVVTSIGFFKNYEA